MIKVSDDEEVKRLVRGLEAFAFAAGIDGPTFARALREVLRRHDVAMAEAAAAMPATSPLKTAVTLVSEGVFVCTLRRGHAGDHWHDPSADVAGQCGAEIISKVPQAPPILTSTEIKKAGDR